MDEKSSQDKAQEYIRCNFLFSQSVYQRLALASPLVEDIAWDHIIEFEENGLPPPEPSISDRKDDGRNS